MKLGYIREFGACPDCSELLDEHGQCPNCAGRYVWQKGAPRSDIYFIYTDGGCSPNPGEGAWAYVRNDGQERSGYFSMSTNNLCELEAVKMALFDTPVGSVVTVITDSMNVIGWLSLGWKRKDFSIAEACKAIQGLITAKRLTVGFEHVSGHSGNDLNERAHWLVQQSRTRKG